MSNEQQGNNQQQGNGGGSVLVAFLLGAAAGAAVALLWAPASGEETRKAMNRRTREGRERVLEALRQGRGVLDQQRENLITTFERARQQVKGAAGATGEPEQDA